MTIADVVLRGGPIYTVDPDFTVAEAIALADGAVLAVGTLVDIEAFIGAATRVIELDGRSVLPGIDDSHLHAAAYGVSSPPFALDLSYPTVTSIAEITEAVRAAAASAPAGQWIVGLGWDIGYLRECTSGSRDMPDRGDLDAASPDHPVCLTDFSGHLVLANSKALELAGVTATTQAPAGGVIDLAADGEPTGILREGAQALVQGLIPRPTYDVRKRAIAEAITRLNAKGITAWTEPGLGPGGEGLLGGALGADSITAYEELCQSGQLTARVSALLMPIGMGESSDQLASRVQEQRAALADVDRRRFAVIGVKLFADGVPPNETAFMYEPYGIAQQHGAMCVHGATEAMQEAELHRALKTVHDLGLQAGVHVTGDHAIDITVDGFVAAQRANPREDARHYVIHGDFISDERLSALGEHGYGVNMNPGIKAQITDLMDTIVGAEMSARQWPTRSALDAGALLCASSDAPVTPPEWLAGISGMMTRRSKATGAVSGPGECVSFETAVRAYTINGAKQSFAEHWRGSLEPGKVADLIVLDADLGAVDPNELTNINVDVTFVDGHIVYQRDLKENP